MESEGLLMCSSKLATGLYLDSVESISHTQSCF